MLGPKCYGKITRKISAGSQRVEIKQYNMEEYGIPRVKLCDINGTFLNHL